MSPADWTLSALRPLIGSALCFSYGKYRKIKECDDDAEIGFVIGDDYKAFFYLLYRLKSRIKWPCRAFDPNIQATAHLLPTVTEEVVS